MVTTKIIKSVEIVRSREECKSPRASDYAIEMGSIRLPRSDSVSSVEQQLEMVRGRTALLAYAFENSLPLQ